MPKVVDAARVTIKDGAVWRECAGCGALAALAPDVNHCNECNAEPIRETAIDALLSMATLHARGLAGAATDFDRMAAAYARLARQARGADADELTAFSADLREAAHRLRTGGRS